MPRPSPRTKLGRLNGPTARNLNIELGGGEGEGAIVSTVLATVVVLKTRAFPSASILNGSRLARNSPAVSYNNNQSGVWSTNADFQAPQWCHVHQAHGVLASGVLRLYVVEPVWLAESVITRASCAVEWPRTKAEKTEVGVNDEKIMMIGYW